METKNNTLIEKEVRTMGIIFIVLGFIHIALSSVLWAAWGVVLIIVGIIAIINLSKNMIRVLGIMLIVIGVMNFISFTIIWMVVAVVQIIWGIQELDRFYKMEKK